MLDNFAAELLVVVLVRVDTTMTANRRAQPNGCDNIPQVNSQLTRVRLALWGCEMVYNATCKTMKQIQGVQEHECERIARLGGRTELSATFDFPTEDIIRMIDSGKDEFYAVDSRQGTKARVRVVKARHGGKYLRSAPDNDRGDNLLNLPACP